MVKSDVRHHKACVTVLRRINEPMGTVWPALTEAIYLLSSVPGGQNAVWDLADAALVRVAEREGIRRFFTVDRQDFGVYRLNGKIRPIVLP